MKKYNNNDFNKSNVKNTYTVHGWVNKIRNIGEIVFVDLRDRSGILQIVFDKKSSEEAFNLANTLKNEYCVEITGDIRLRSNPNLELPTGEIELIASKLVILNECETLPFNIYDTSDLSEAVGLKYRYLMLRKEKLKKIILTRHKIVKATRDYLDSLGFIEIETPILCKSTPEGARDYVVPSRIQKGYFYALPQSPQIFKQLLMVGGFEKYYQIARCFRDEDLRSDRQPEFTQIDIEMSFANEFDVWDTVEGMMKKIVKDIKGIDLNPFPRLTYKEVMDDYGSDKPDTRFDMKLQDITKILSKSEFSLYNEINDEVIKAIVLKNNASNISRKDIDLMTDEIKKYGAKNLTFLKYEENEFTGGVTKNLSDEVLNELKMYLKIDNNDLVLIVKDKYKVVSASLGYLRLKLGKKFNLYDPKQFNFLWVTDFPMFEYSEADGRYYAAHHPFTMPNDVELLSEPEKCLARAYDIVVNGYELASGSVRIHDAKIQSKVFEKLGISEEEAKEKFGFFLDAFKFGAPPHAGIAPGLDRLVMVLCETDDVKDVIAFPKTQTASDLMNESPSSISLNQLEELGLKIVGDNK